MDDDIPTRPPVAYPYDPGMQRRERSWIVMAGSRRLSFTRIDHHAVAPPRRIAAHAAPRRRSSLTGAIALVLGSVASVATLGMAMNASRAATGHYLISVAVPARIPFHAAPLPPSPVKTVPRRVAAVAPIDAAPALVTAAPADEGASYAAASPPPRLEAMQPAIDAALLTGALQQWTSADGLEQGFVVAGPADRGCRMLSILTRRDGGNNVEKRRECAPPASGGTTTP